MLVSIKMSNILNYRYRKERLRTNIESVEGFEVVLFDNIKLEETS